MDSQGDLNIINSDTLYPDSEYQISYDKAVSLN